jgi:DNA-binding response OmpR family regulator
VTLAGREIALTPKEFGILECLASDPGRVVSRPDILDQARAAHWSGPMGQDGRGRGREAPR